MALKRTTVKTRECAGVLHRVNTLRAVGIAACLFVVALGMGSVLVSCSSPTLNSPTLLEQEDVAPQQDLPPVETQPRTARDVAETALDAASGTPEINLFDEKGALRNVDWTEVPEVATAVQAFSDAGYSSGFIVYDFASGKGLGYNSDAAFFSASTIKAPYVAYVSQSLVDDGWATLDDEVYESMVMDGTGIMSSDEEDAYDLATVLFNTIVYSDNTGYALLRENYDGNFEDWAAAIGVDASAWEGGWYPYYTPRDLAKLWLGVDKYLESGQGSSSLCDGLFARTENSFIRRALGSDRRILAKPGFEIDMPDADVGALNDAGIVHGAKGNYLIAVMSDADYDNEYYTETEELMVNLIRSLDKAHAQLLSEPQAALPSE